MSIRLGKSLIAHRLFGALPFGLALTGLLPAASSFAATYYIAPGGADTNAGTLASPFLTIMRAQAAASSGDTVYLHGGTYSPNNSDLTATNSPWVIVNNITKSDISYVAYPGERPVFNFANVKPVGYRVTAFLVTADDCVFKGFDVTGVQVTIQTNHTQSECFRIAGGNNNHFEQLAMHDGMGIGWYLTGGASNLVLNCDAYNNRGLDSGSLGNIDGFGCHPNKTGGTGNVLRGCRAWFNSDDGFDLINAWAPVTIENCWAFYNGYFTNFVSSTGDGNGFKSGGYGRNGKAIPNPVPRHVTQFCVSVRNRANGFYANHHTGGLDWISNTAYRNNVNYNMLCTLSDNLTDVPGYSQFMKNNLGYLGNTQVTNLDTNSSDVSFNYFTLPVAVSSNDFVSLDESQLTQPRQINGDLPEISFLHLANGSGLIDKGTNVGYAFNGAAPDLGAFEKSTTPPPRLTSLVCEGDDMVLTWVTSPVKTNFVEATTDLGTDFADITGPIIPVGNGDVTTNYPDLGATTNFPARFYRVRLVQ
ncbi:MAG TPA: pectate lyase [Verrucomicrobiae bacterium]|nr:pectate lyase [Verrucomicrobiae bacterium]